MLVNEGYHACCILCMQLQQINWYTYTSNIIITTITAIIIIIIVTSKATKANAA